MERSFFGRKSDLSIEIADGTAAATGLVVAFSGGEDNAAVIRSVSAVGTRVR